jgi:hypothetical protein
LYGGGLMVVALKSDEREATRSGRCAHIRLRAECRSAAGQERYEKNYRIYPKHPGDVNDHRILATMEECLPA